MRRELQVRFWEGAGVRFPRATRLGALEACVLGDTRLRTAASLAGLGAAAVGARRGQHTLTAVGTEAIRITLERQFTAIHVHTGLSVTPAIDRRGFTVVLTRFF